MRQVWLGMCLIALGLSGCGMRASVASLPEPVPAATPSEDGSAPMPSTLRHRKPTAVIDPADTCPVDGEHIAARSCFADAHGRRYYLCSPACAALFRQAPEAYLASHDAWAVKWSEPLP